MHLEKEKKKTVIAAMPDVTVNNEQSALSCRG